ncbi:glutaminyl-peptide cyclotransferas-like protein [Amylocarpus encephaloides]|uniref:Peptide hydrolase n=1 Tax=Amylocarpus encephaloides TaxID=45428 RepID=A0A9P7YI49_9HELO|nr:glutaminyl-peptide cyclotransferas-like protein [Amylocarpus encephaloides]
MLDQRFSNIWLVLACVLLRTALGLTPLSDDSLRNLPIAGADFDIKSGGILAPILVPRVPGTPGSKRVQQHFVDWFSTNLPNWHIDYQNSTSKTPATGDKQVPFVNIILTRDPPWAREGNIGRLALVAHYDTLITPEGFIGAIDSAAPCAMIMHAARSVDEAMTRKWAAMEAEGSSGLEEEKGVQILFLDGEEAFVHWTDDDSLYGARALAESWESTYHPAMSTYQNKLDSVSLFLLLDLLGSAKPRIPSYFKTTHWAYQHMALLESRMRTMELLATEVDHPFLPEHDKDPDTFRMRFGIQDDHIPFMARGVEILHIIPTPFPEVWHNHRGVPDDGEHLDMPTVDDWAKILTAFVAEWMDLEGYFSGQAEIPDNAKRSVSKRKTEFDLVSNRVQR